MKKSRIVVGLSGGVDSAVTAKILVDQGHEVVGIFMKNWDDEDDPHCPAAVDAIDARNVAAKLEIPFYTVNFAKEYWDNVFEYFLEQHRLFRTPNPDILCNKFIKFKSFLKHAEDLKADFIATGHYARNIFNEKKRLFELQTPKDANKDQTYFLYTLQQHQLAKTLFPLADYPKSEIRKIAKEAGFENANKKDSTGICFVGERDYMTFLKKYLHQQPGEIVTEKGDVIGKHIGLSFYTIGQRRNLNIGGVRGYPEAPWFLLTKDIEKNQIVVCQDDDNPKLLSNELMVGQLDWVSGISPVEAGETIELLCKIRYRQKNQHCTVTLGEKGKGKEESLMVQFKEPQRAVTAGQAAVFYSLDGKICLGGGEIS